MRRALLFWLAVGVIIPAAARELPPVPDPAQAMKQQQVLETCRVPPQLVVLPPQVEPDYIECANRYYRPDADQAAHRLSEMLGREVEIGRIVPAEGFIRAYEVDLLVGDQEIALLCNDRVTHCYKRGGRLEESIEKD